MADTNPYITKAQFVKITNQGMNVTDPSFVASLIKEATSPSDLIDKIEEYNDTHKLNEHNRIRYGVNIYGAYITVIKATKSGEFYKIVAQDFNGKPKAITNTNTGKIESLSGTLHTHFVPVAAIMDVVISGYDPEVIDPIINNKGIDEIDERQLVSNFRNLTQTFNAMLSAGELRNYVKMFNYEFKNNNYNDYTYEHKIEAFNLYNRLADQYLTTIKTIVANSYELGKIERPENVRDHSIYFVDGDLETYLTKYISKIWKDEPKEMFDARLQGRIEELSQKTFTSTEVEWFKDIIK